MIGLGVLIYIYIHFHTSPVHCTFPMTRSVRYQPIFNGLKVTLHCTRILNNLVITTVIEMVEMVEILDGRVGKSSVERVRYVIKKLLHLVIVKYGVISLVLCISTRLRLVTILTLLVKYLIIFHADPCNKSYIYVCGPKKIESYFSDQLTFSNIRGRTSRRFYRLVLALLSLETLPH